MTTGTERIVVTRFCRAVTQAALDHMIERGTGRIISVSSVIGETGNIGQANYAASKSGLFGLTKSLAREAIFQLNRAQLTTARTWPEVSAARHSTDHG